MNAMKSWYFHPNHRKRVNLAVLVLALIVPVPRAPAEAAADIKPESQPAKPPLTERDYLVEELQIAEQQLAADLKREEISQTPPDKALTAKRTVLSLKRQLAAYDERNKDKSPEATRQKARRQEENQSREADRSRKAAAKKQELLPALLEILSSDADTQVRQAAMESISRFQLESSIEPLAQVILKDPDAQVRQIALQIIAQFKSAASTEALLKLYDGLGQDDLKRMAIFGLRETQRVSNPEGAAPQTVETVSSKALAKLTQIARDSGARELRLAALQQLSPVPQEEVTTALISIYDGTTDAEIKQALIQHLGGRGGELPQKKLLAIAKTDPDPRSRQAAVYALGHLPDELQRYPQPPRISAGEHPPLSPLR